MTLPFVSCICPTFGRYPTFGHLVAEAVESFLRQDYPPSRCELIVLNDCPQQELFMNAGPMRCRVRVINHPIRFASLGEKYNHMIGLAMGDLIVPWEDDDVSLPHRISQAVRMLGEYDYWKPQQVWYVEQGRWSGFGPRHDWRWQDSKFHWKHAVGVRHHASIFRRSAWARVGGYPHASGSQDAQFDAALRRLCRVAPEGDLHPSEWAYLYRWHVSPCHLSGSADSEKFYQEWGKRPVVAGSFSVEPHWYHDYVSSVKETARDASI